LQHPMKITVLDRPYERLRRLVGQIELGRIWSRQRSSFIRAVFGPPLMVAIIGGETCTFRPLIDLNRAGRRGGHLPGHLKVGIHSIRYVGDYPRSS